MSTTVGANAATHTPHWASDCALPPRCLVAHLCGDGRLPPLRARPRRLERSRFVSRRSAHGSRPCLGGPIQPPTACYRHSQPQRGPNAARNVALYGRPAAAHCRRPSLRRWLAREQRRRWRRRGRALSGGRPPVTTQVGNEATRWQRAIRGPMRCVGGRARTYGRRHS